MRETEYSLQGTDDLKEMQIYDLVTFDYEALKSAIQVLFEQKQIWISKKEQRSINFNSMDEYFDSTDRRSWKILKSAEPGKRTER